MGVSECGAYAGSLSGGCIEAAVVAEAQMAIRAGQPHQVAFGAGSSYIDIRLPCGGRIDLLFTPLVQPEFVAQITEVIARRLAFTFHLPLTAGTPTVLLECTPQRVQVAANRVSIGHLPDLRLALLGNGASVDALCRQARSLDIATTVYAPDHDILARAAATGATSEWLKAPGVCADFAIDAWTAAVFYFHDHDWETALLAQALASPAFFVGAMGSYKTHAMRCSRLRALGVSDEAIAQLAAPIGLIPSSRDPETLALSTLAQVVAKYHARVALASPLN